MTQPQTQGFLSPSDIAELAGVSRAAVSNWRRRRADFPAAVAGSDAKPLFSRPEVLAWLSANDYSVREESPGERLWSQVNRLRGHMETDEVVSLLMLLASLKKASATGLIRFDYEAFVTQPEATQIAALGAGIDQLHTLPNFDRLEIAVPRDERASLALPVLAQAVAQTAPEDLAAATDLVLERFSRWQIKAGAEHGFVGSRTSALGAALTAGTTGVVYDPACGIANVLVKTAETGTPERLIGRDISNAAVLLASQRALLHDVAIDLAVADVLTEDPDTGLSADVVFLEPPFGMQWNPTNVIFDPRFEYGMPTRTSADMAWLQHALAHLNATGTAYLLTAAGSLSRGGSDRKTRANLLATGCVRAIIGLPPRMLPHTAIAPVLWVLNRGGNNTDVLFIDASDVDDFEQQIPTWLAADTQAIPAPHTRVDIAEVIAAEATLVPAQWTTSNTVDEAAISEAYAHATHHITTITSRISDTQPLIEPGEQWPDSRLVTVGELIDRGVLERRIGRPTRERAQDTGVVTVADVRTGDFPTPDADAVADPAKLTAPGDVLITTLNEVHTLVDTKGGHLPSANVEVLTICQPEYLLPGYLAAVLTGSWNARHQRGASIQRARVADLEIPLVGLAHQHTIERAHHTATALRHDAQDLADSAETAFNAVLDALRYNIDLTPDQAQK